MVDLDVETPFEEHTVEVPDRDTMVPIECQGCGNTFTEYVGGSVAGASCPDCGDMNLFSYPGDDDDEDAADPSSTQITFGQEHSTDDDQETNDRTSIGQSARSGSDDQGGQISLTESVATDGGDDVTAECLSCGETARGNDCDPQRFAEIHTAEVCPAGEPVIDVDGPADLGDGGTSDAQ